MLSANTTTLIYLSISFMATTLHSKYVTVGAQEDDQSDSNKREHIVQTLHVNSFHKTTMSLYAVIILRKKKYIGAEAQAFAQASIRIIQSC